MQEESAQSSKMFQTHQAEMSVLRADNVNLVGKLRYAESFAKRAGQQPGDLSIVRVDDAGVPNEQASWGCICFKCHLWKGICLSICIIASLSTGRYVSELAPGC